MEKRKLLGLKGESLASKYLEENSYKILEKNFKISRLEIDIIAQKNNEIIFIEVKTRRSNSLEEVENSFKKSQISRIKKAINIYAELKNINLENIRFDFIAIAFNQETERASLKHFVDILK